MRQQALGVMHRQRAGRGHEVDTVRQRQPFLGFQDQPLDAGARHRFSAGEEFAAIPRLPAEASIAIDAVAIISIAVPDGPRQHRRDVRQRGEITTGTQRAFGGHARCHTGVEHIDQRLRHDGTHARMPLGQHVGADGHHRPHDLVGQRVANPHHAQQDQVRESCRASSALICRLAREPKPVFTP